MSRAFQSVLTLSLLVATAASAQLETPDTIWRQGAGGVPGTAQAGDKFGEAFASGDFNGDGIQDLAVGIGEEGSDAGAVQIFFGSPAGLIAISPVIVQSSLVGIGDPSEAGDRFGAAVAAGNFNGDAYDDLAIGAPGETLGGALRCGVVHILYGSPTGLLMTGSKYLHQNQVDSAGAAGGAETDDDFGRALVAGDFDGDGLRNDLAIGVPAETVVTGSVKQGGVQVVYGPFPVSATSMGSNAFFSQVNLGGAGSAPQDLEGFGTSLAAGYLNNDSYEDLAIGVPFDEHGSGVSVVKSGSVHVLFGASGGLQANTTLPWNNNSPFDLGWSEGDRFGLSLAIGDYDGDGYEDLAIGVPWWRINEQNREVGLVHILYGAASAGQLGAQRDTLKQGVHGIGGSGETAEAGDRFGFSLAAGRFAEGVGSGYDYLAIGAPGEDVDGTNSAGVVNIAYGSANGLNAAESNSGFSQNSANFGTGESCEAFDQLGYALGTGDWNGDGKPDLAIGVPLENIGAITDGGIFHVISFPLPLDIFLDEFESNDLSSWDEVFEGPSDLRRR